MSIMAFTSADLDAIDRAIASGELTVRNGESLVTYRSMDELLKARDKVAASLDTAAATPRSYPRYQLADFSDD